jgi:hypothetical protein
MSFVNKGQHKKLISKTKKIKPKQQSKQGKEGNFGKYDKVTIKELVSSFEFLCL